MKSLLPLSFAMLSAVMATSMPSPASAGVLLAPTVYWQTFAFRPLDVEETPNYYGYGLGFDAGYSAAQIVDFSLYARYTPATLKDAHFGQESAATANYGVGLGFRIARAIYLGFHGGPMSYRLVSRHEDSEVGGKWAGVGGMVSLGAMQMVGKTHFWQASVDLGSGRMKSLDDDTADLRTLDTFGVTITYVYNGNDSWFESGGMFRAFVNSLGN